MPPHRRYFVVFFLFPPPPSSTLFPYTTLFRSFRVHPETVTGATIPEQLAGSVFDLDPGVTYELELHAFDPDGDRKSTRLNSSHSQTSYAVFCLKKKTNTARLRLCTPAHTPPTA